MLDVKNQLYMIDSDPIRTFGSEFENDCVATPNYAPSLEILNEK